MGSGVSVAQQPDGSGPWQILLKPAPPKEEDSKFPRELPKKLREARSLVDAKIWSEEDFEKEKASLLRINVSALDSSKFDATDEVQRGVSVLCRGYEPNSAPIVPLGPHNSREVLFDLQKVRDFTATNFHKEPRADVSKIAEDSVKSFASSLESKLGLSGSGGWGGASVSGSLSAELNLGHASKSSRHYVQHRSSYARRPCEISSLGWSSLERLSLGRAATDSAPSWPRLDRERAVKGSASRESRRSRESRDREREPSREARRTSGDPLRREPPRKLDSYAVRSSASSCCRAPASRPPRSRSSWSRRRSRR